MHGERRSGKAKETRELAPAARVPSYSSGSPELIIAEYFPKCNRHEERSMGVRAAPAAPPDADGPRDGFFHAHGGEKHK